MPESWCSTCYKKENKVVKTHTTLTHNRERISLVMVVVWLMAITFAWVYYLRQDIWALIIGIALLLYSVVWSTEWYFRPWEKDRKVLEKI